MTLYNDSGECLVESGDYVLVSPLSVIWDHNICYDDPLYKTNGWKITPPDDDEWYKVTHVFRKGDGDGIQGWSCLGHPIFCLVEIPQTSVVYDRFTKLCDVNELVYGRDMIEHYGINRELNHRKLIAELFESFIKDFKKKEDLT